MLTIYITKIKNWLINISEKKNEVDIEEITRIEAKHTRVRFDRDIYEVIKVQ